jgi:2'-5' RNA ligase
VNPLAEPGPRTDDPARLFLGLWPTPPVRSGLLGWRDACTWTPGAKVVAAERLHVTLHFIGAVPRSEIDRVRTGLAMPAPPFELRFGRPEMWPHGLAVLAPLEVPEALAALHARLGAALQRLALPVESRPFRPHVTLARRAAGTRLVEAADDVCWAVDNWSLIESRPGGGGYQVLETWG